MPGLIKALDNDKAAYWACVVLREIGPAGKDAIPALTAKLQDPRPEIRREAVLALAAMEGAAAGAAPQIAALLDDQQCRTAATYALGRIGTVPADAEAKIRANFKSDDPMLCCTSLWTLALVHPEDKDLRRQTTEGLVAMLKNSDPRVPPSGGQGIGCPAARPGNHRAHFREGLPGRRRGHGPQRLGCHGISRAQAVPRLVGALKFEKARARVAYILGQIGPAAAPATEELAKLIADKNPRVSEEAVLALAKIGPAAKAAVPALTKAFQGGQGSDDYAIAYALGKIGPDAAAAAAALTAALGSSDSSLAVACAWALGQIQPASAEVAAKTVPVLIAGLGAPLPQSRQAAAEALGSLGPLAADAAPALEKARSDPDENVQRAVAAALKSIVAPEVRPHRHRLFRRGE